MEESKRITEDILAEAQKKAKEILDAAKKEAESILQAAEISGREEKENLVSAGKAKGQRLFREKVMAARLESRRQLLLRREELLLSVFQEAKKELEKFVASKNYVNWMEKELEKAGEELGKQLEVEVRKEDMRILEELRKTLEKKGIEVRIGSAINCLGGFRARTPDGKMMMDCTFERKLERVGEEARLRIAKVLFG